MCYGMGPLHPTVVPLSFKADADSQCKIDYFSPNKGHEIGLSDIYSFNQ